MRSEQQNEGRKKIKVCSEFVGQNFLVEWELPPSKSVRDSGKKLNEGGMRGEILTFGSPFIRMHKFGKSLLAQFLQQNCYIKKFDFFFHLFSVSFKIIRQVRVAKIEMNAQVYAVFSTNYVFQLFYSSRGTHMFTFIESFVRTCCTKNSQLPESNTFKRKSYSSEELFRSPSRSTITNKNEKINSK